MPRPHGGRLAELTHLAVVRGAALTASVGPDQLAAAQLASLLYRAGGVALDPADDRIDPRWPHQLAVVAQRAAGPAVEAYDRVRTPHWNGWSRPGTDSAALAHKIYVSPTVAGLTTALPIVFGTATARGVAAWKIGAEPAALHRPDKIVLYAATAAEADDVALALAGALGAALDPTAVQGVPFTGQVGDTAMVSRGRDVGRDSWRHVVCRAVALALIRRRVELGWSATADHLAAAALDLVAQQGVDVITWHPEGASALVAS